MNRMINRTLIATLSVVALLVTVLAFGAPGDRLTQQDSTLPVAVAGGAPVSAALATGEVPPDTQAVTGEVVLSTPSELVLHTSSGMQRFSITPETQMLVPAAEGDTVTVLYKPAVGAGNATVVKTTAANAQSTSQGAATAEASTSAATAAGASTEPPATAEAVSGSEAGAMAAGTENAGPAVEQQRSSSDTGPTTASSVSGGQPPVESSQPTNGEAATQRVTKLPKTASPLPLIGLIGLLTLVGAVVLGAVRY